MGITNRAEKKYHNQRQNTYADIEIRKENLDLFHNLFMEGMAESWKYDLERLKLKRAEELTQKKEKEIFNDSRFLFEHIGNLWKLMVGIRQSIKNEYNTSEMSKRGYDAQCKDGVNGAIFWMKYFAWTYDPRMTSLGLNPKIPFIPTISQQQALREIMGCMGNREGVLIEKSRSEGITEMLAALDAHQFLYKSLYKSGWGSRTEKLVDTIGNRDTIFEKIRSILFDCPKEMLPKGFSRKSDYNKRLALINPDNGAVIIGEGGINIGRGGRTGVYKVDEKAFLENPKSADDALSQNTDCQIDISTPNGQDEFYDKRMSGRVTVITLWWYKNPSKNVNWADGLRPKDGECYWYEYQKLTRDPVTVAKEIDIDYLSSVGDNFIKPEWVRAAINFPLEKRGERAAGFDIAAGGKDLSVYVSRIGPVVNMPVPVPADNPLKATMHAAHLGREDDIRIFNYDQNAFGEDVYPLLKENEFEVPFDINGIYGQGKASTKVIDDEGRRANEKFRNKRAEIWWKLRTLFQNTYNYTRPPEDGVPKRAYAASELISIPEHSKMIVELSSPKIMFSNSGKIGVESKVEMARRNVKSPDFADALAYCFCEDSLDDKVIQQATVSKIETISKFQYDFNGPKFIYTSIFNTEDTKVYAGIFIWNVAYKILQMIAEYEFDDFDPDYIRDVICTKTEYNPIKMWVGNKEIFEGLDKGREGAWYAYRRAKIPLKANFTHDRMQSINYINQMLKSEKLMIHTDCKRTLGQIRNWKSIKDNPQGHLHFMTMLAQIMTTLKKKGLIELQTESKVPAYMRRN